MFVECLNDMATFIFELVKVAIMTGVVVKTACHVIDKSSKK